MDAGTEIGSYRIEGLLGKGGMAEVYKAWHLNLHRHEALKVLPPQMTFDHSFVERFLHEARTAAQLHHSNIATIHAVSDDAGPQYYFAMELVEGGDLADLLEQRGALPLDESLSILLQAAKALDYAHSRGVVHRDIKPGNMLLGSADGSICVKMVDFGIARAQSGASSTRLTRTGMIIGTPEYMSPEQAGSGAPVDHRTDLYSLGVVAYEMVCGQPPFRAQTDTSPMSVMMAHVRDIPRPPVELVPGLATTANNAILKALAKDPRERFHTCAEFVDALSGALIVSLPPVLHATAAPPYQAQPSAAAPTAPRAAEKVTAQIITTPTSASRTMPLVLGLAVLGGLGLVGFGMRNTGSPNPSANSDSTTGSGTTANSTATGSGGSSTIGSSSSLPPGGAAGMTTSSAPSQIPLQLSLEATSDSEVADAKRSMLAESEIIVGDDAGGWHRCGASTVKMKYNIEDTGSSSIPYIGRVVISVEQAVTDTFPRAAEAIRAPISHEKLSTNTLTYSYHDGQWQRQSSDK